MTKKSLFGVLALAFALPIGLLAIDRSGRAFTVAAAREPLTQISSENWPQPAPPFIGGPADWINTDGKPIKRKKGVVYLIDFWEYTCVNCIRTLPYLAEWQKRYEKDGLVIIGIHTPEFEFAHDRKNVAQAVKNLGITWPVLVDSDRKNWDAYRNSYWPRKYFIDSNGRIVADHSGEGGYEESEARIQQLLKEAHPDLTFPKVMAPVRGTDKPGARCYPTTAEVYAGERGAFSGQHGNILPYELNRVGTYQDPGGTHEDGKIYLQGRWRTERESVRHARVTSDRADYLALRYHALECNAVIKPEGGKPIRVYIAQDNKPVAKTDRGADIRYDEQGHSYLQVDEPRMYQLIKNPKFGYHELKLASQSPDFGLYSFTFSSCERAD